MATRRFHLPALCLGAMLFSGCYTYSAQLADRPAPGTEIAATLNDRGRVDLAQQLGPEVWQVEGSLTGADDSTVTISMLRTTTLEHADMRWAGEVVTIRRDYFRSMMGRRFSPGRTVVLAGTATAGVVAFLATRSLLGFGTGVGGPGSGGGTGAQ